MSALAGAVLAIQAGEATLTVAPWLGGAWTSLTWRGSPVLRPTPDAALTDANVRLTAGYPLVPYSNRIRAARLRFAGTDHPLARNFGDHPHAIHGVGWQRAWRVVAHDRARLQLALVNDPASPADQGAWPWPFEAVHTVQLASDGDGGAALTARLTLASRAATPFPFGLGWHPFFPRAAATTLAFRAGAVWRNDADSLPVRQTDIPPEWNFASARRVEAALDQVFTQWDGTATLDAAGAGHRIVIEADRACANLVVYAPTGRDFLALEPVTQETDAFNRAADGARDTGIRVLPPGGAFSCTMRLTVAPLA